MSRQTFMAAAAVVAALFSAVMVFAPDKMMEGMGTTLQDTTKIALQAVAAMLFAIAVMTFLARKDEGSVALRAVMIGNIVLHIIATPIDWIAYSQGIFPQISGFLPGTVVHVIFGAGFVYYLWKLPGNSGTAS
jgi:hypothetical protein